MLQKKLGDIHRRDKKKTRSREQKTNIAHS